MLHWKQRKELNKEVGGSINDQDLVVRVWPLSGPNPPNGPPQLFGFLHLWPVFVAVFVSLSGGPFWQKIFNKRVTWKPSYGGAQGGEV